MFTPPLGNITSTNTIAVLSFPDIWPIIPLEQFSTDTGFSGDAVQIAEVFKTVDGKTVAGSRSNIIPITFTFKASAPCLRMINDVVGRMQKQHKIYEAKLSLTFPSIAKSVLLSEGTIVETNLFPGFETTLGDITCTFHFGRKDGN